MKVINDSMGGLVMLAKDCGSYQTNKTENVISNRTSKSLIKVRCSFPLDRALNGVLAEPPVAVG